MPFKGVFRLIAMAPILVPSLLPGIALVYLFGNQGMLKAFLLGESIYGPIGIVIGSVFFTFPHAMIIITTALAISDARLYEAAECLKASRWRRSEEHTSELQSLMRISYAVFCLKKKTKLSLLTYLQHK